MGTRPRRQVRAPNRLGWEDHDDANLGEIMMDSDSVIPNTDSGMDSDSDEESNLVSSQCIKSSHCLALYQTSEHNPVILIVIQKIEKLAG